MPIWAPSATALTAWTAAPGGWVWKRCSSPRASTASSKPSASTPTSQRTTPDCASGSCRTRCRSTAPSASRTGSRRSASTAWACACFSPDAWGSVDAAAIGARAPVFPRPVQPYRLRQHVLRARELAGTEIFHLVGQVHRLGLQPRVHLQVDRGKHHLTQRAARNGAAVPAHERDAVRAQRRGEVPRLGHVHDQHAGIAEPVANVPDRHFLADRGADVQHGPQLHRRDAVRDDGVRMVVHHRADVRAPLVDGAVDETLGVRRAPARVDRRAVEREFHEIVGRDQLRAARAGHQEAVWALRVADADMAERIDHAFAREDAVRDRKLAQLVSQIVSFVMSRTPRVRQSTVFGTTPSKEARSTERTLFWAPIACPLSWNVLTAATIILRNCATARSLEPKWSSERSVIGPIDSHIAMSCAGMPVMPVQSPRFIASRSCR